MGNVLNEMQQLRLLLAKESNFDLAKAEKVYNFIVGEQPKSATVSDTTAKPDGIYFILSPSNMIHESLATDEDKRNSIAIGVKMGDMFANVALYDAAGGKEVSLCKDGKIPCGSQPFFRKTFREAMADRDGIASTNDIRNSLNPEINLGENEYIPSVAQLHLILLNINEVNKALVEAGGEQMRDNWCWSSTEFSGDSAWLVDLGSCETDTCTKVGRIIVRTAVVCEI